MNPDLALALLGFGLAGVTTYILTHLKHLEALPSSDECEEYPRVSIVIPVRNEEDTVNYLPLKRVASPLAHRIADVHCTLGEFGWGWFTHGSPAPQHIAEEPVTYIHATV